ncbi:formimidoylglutamate deiminase [Cohaesibacter sp. CAU 1516]|uniref:formimidoylglutamate deiminase n=1 Tax=Cohaesibacter sp. CAU 1516 TaxID=2576038 RepID=UPI0010FEB7E3|nr:formimidoylglutamate deiminase [Cohaesibacter sp. CAU 1516]TLP48741.1 formimidoylglutamate deiminase [Cohaesibacter sp. CAU 1516]
MMKIRAKSALLTTGWAKNVDICLTKAGKIERISPQAGPMEPADHHADLILPAPVNLHSHAFQRAMSGLTEAKGPDPKDSFWTWRRLMYKFLDQLTPDQMEAIAALAFMEMAEAGFGSVAEFHYFHHAQGGVAYDRLSEMADRIAAAAQATGLGLTLLPVFYQYGGCDQRPLVGGQRRFGNDFDQFAKLYQEAEATVLSGPDDWTIGVAPHSLRAVDPEGLKRAVQLAGDKPLHMHLAEQVPEVEELVAHRKARPVEWLLANHDVKPNWCLIHCTQMTSDETVGLANTGAVAGLCPITEGSLGDGIFNGVAFAQAGGQIGVGSDSDIQISLWEELKQLEYSQRLRDRSRAAYATTEKSTGRFLFDAVVAGGAQAAQRAAGGLEAGAEADLIALDTDNECICGREGDVILDSLIFSGRGQGCITDVWSAGRPIVKQGRHIARDAIVDRYKAVMKQLDH